MNFKDVKMLLEEGAESIATTFDTYEKNGKYFVRFNNKTMDLETFVKKAKKGDPEANDVLAKLKQHPDYSKAGNLYSFITKLLKDDDGRLDLVIKKGITQYDNNEIDKNLHKAKEEKAPRFLEQRRLAVPASQKTKYKNTFTAPQNTFKIFQN